MNNKYLKVLVLCAVITALGAIIASIISKVGSSAEAEDNSQGNAEIVADGSGNVQVNGENNTVNIVDGDGVYIQSDNSVDKASNELDEKGEEDEQEMIDVSQQGQIPYDESPVETENQVMMFNRYFENHSMML